MTVGGEMGEQRLSYFIVHMHEIITSKEDV